VAAGDVGAATGAFNSTGAIVSLFEDGSGAAVTSTNGSTASGVGVSGAVGALAGAAAS